MRRVLVAITLVLASATPVQAEVKDAAPDGFTVENTAVVPVDATSVWSALVGEIDAWWPKDHSWWGADATLSIEPRAGGCFCEVAGDHQAQHMAVTHVEPGKLLRMTGGLGPLQGMGLHGALEFRLEPVEGAAEPSTRITLYYRVGGYSPDDLSTFAPVVDKVQAQQLGGLVDHLRRSAPARIEALETQVAAMTARMGEPAFYQRDGDAIAADNTALAAVQAELDAAYARWRELET